MSGIRLSIKNLAVFATADVCAMSCDVTNFMASSNNRTQQHRGQGMLCLLVPRIFP